MPVCVAYVGMGSNLGERAGHLARARLALASAWGLRLLASSRIYETRPVGGPPQGCYLNAVVALEAALEAPALLQVLQRLERDAGRVPQKERNVPRTLDLDLLLYGEQQICETGLQVPHPRLAERAFVLEPLAELAPGLRPRGLGANLRKLAARVRDPAAVYLWKEDGAWPLSP